jgi:hypothetical protein
MCSGKMVRSGWMWSGQAGSGHGMVRSGRGPVNFEIRRTKYHLVSFREIWNEILFFKWPPFLNGLIMVGLILFVF